MAFDNFLDKVSELTQTGIAKGKEWTDAGKAKAKELKEVGKLRMENASEQETIRKAYLEIGRLYYAEHGTQPEEAYAGLCDKITAAKAKVEYNLERIADIKAAGGLEDDEVDFPEMDSVEPDGSAASEDCGCGCEHGDDSPEV